MFSRLKKLLDGGTARAAVLPQSDRRAAWSGEAPVQPRHVLCFLGRNRELRHLRDAANAAIAEFATGFGIDEAYSAAEPDERMSRSFEVCRDRVAADAWTPQDDEAVGTHQSVLYVLGPRMTRESAVRASIGALFLVDRLIDAGAVAIKGESAGVAHGLHRWRELIRMGAVATDADDALAQNRVCRLAFALRPLASDGYFESVGFHLAGLPDVQVPRLRGSDRDAVVVIDGVADEIVRRGIDATLQAHDASLIDDGSHDEDDFKFNPYGIVRLST
ncbi:hypothetical protein [Burkholderia sp. S-53]|uniref:hypothetical protein n=1 Tax=Burkholderia sp. S-53 TaxID=2906514 RepID=UPI0021CE943D|nr:hypothetical protein [Burkholderia sp. S-53]UXU91452.1 hypothetical protein LXM88_25120 [Burkholderia sp. S-53]